MGRTVFVGACVSTARAGAGVPVWPACTEVQPAVTAVYSSSRDKVSLTRASRRLRSRPRTPSLKTIPLPPISVAGLEQLATQENPEKRTKNRRWRIRQPAAIADSPPVMTDVINVSVQGGRLRPPITALPSPASTPPPHPNPPFLCV